MPSYRLGEHMGIIHLEDADIDTIRKGLEIIASSGLPKQSVDEVATSITIHECAKCERKWAADNVLFFLPHWSKQNDGRGRKTKLEEVNKALEHWNRGRGTMCEPCLMEEATTFAQALLTLDNKSLKRFFHVYEAQIEMLKRDYDKKFFDGLPYRFHVKFITAVFESLSQRKKTAFAAMTNVMNELELL